MKKLLLAGVVLISFLGVKGQSNFPFQNHELPVEQRVNDMVSRMTLEEKVSQMVHASVAIPRLDIPEYNWWNECLHGVARAGVATVFPQAIGLAATWNEDLMFDVASATSDEARAKHHKALREGQHGIYRGLSFWTPNINIFRDPRWGRGQETYGEDPYLTSRMGVAFVKGLQGDDPYYLKLIATPKHYAVHSGPEPDRHHFNAVTNEKDLWETYLPAFEATIKEADAWSVMGAYNRYLGESCCAHPYLLQDVLRDKWGFKGYVVSDCGGISDIYRTHKLVDTPEAAAALAVKSGLELNCGSVYKALVKAVEKKLITEEEIDVAVGRLMEARIRLGMFDPEEKVPFASIPESVIDCQIYKDLALQTARQSIVLLKNEKKTLPLSKNLKKIAVIGPNADEHIVMYGNYNGTPSKSYSVLEGIQEKMGSDAEVFYTKGADLYYSVPAFDPIPSEWVKHPGGGNGWKMELFNNRELKGKTDLELRPDEINFNWGNGSPADGMNADEFSVRIQGTIVPQETKEYELVISGDDGYRLLMNDTEIIDSWKPQSETTNKYKLKMEAGKEYKIRIEYFESIGGAVLKFGWNFPGSYDKRVVRLKEEKKKVWEQTMTEAASCDAIVFVGGISPALEGEEMGVNVDGFHGGDRTSMKLPSIQEDMLKELHKIGKPVVFVMMNGSALAVNWADKELPAIVEAWYPGQAGGRAVADVLFGDYNPAGRLPVTFYHSVDDLPPFEDYNMKGRTYRFFDGDVLYPFGYGLSYSSFKYGKVDVPASASAEDIIQVNVTLSNRSEMDGDEVIQVYLKGDEGIKGFSLRSLVGFKRVNLKAGETKIVKVPVKIESFRRYDEAKKNYTVDRKTYKLEIGSSSANIHQKAKITIM